MYTYLYICVHIYIYIYVYVYIYICIYMNGHVGVPVLKFDKKLGALTKTDAFSVFNKFAYKDPDSGCAELDADAFAKGMCVSCSVLQLVAACCSVRYRCWLCRVRF